MDLKDQKELFQAARSGNLFTVMVMLRADPLVLDKVALIPSGDTPFHIATFFGQTRFVEVFLKLKPGLARELNQAGHTPLHTASALGNLLIVSLLQGLGQNLGLIKDKKGQTPLHHAVMRGRVRVIEELVHWFPMALRILTDRGDTVLHVAVKNKLLRAMRALLNTIDSFDRETITHANQDGFTVVQLAEFSGQDGQEIAMLRERELLFYREQQSTGGGSAREIPQVQGDASVRSDRREIRAEAAANVDDTSSGIELQIPSNEQVPEIDTGIEIQTPSNEQVPKIDTEDDRQDYYKDLDMLWDEICSQKSESKAITVVEDVIQVIIRFCFWALKRAYGFDEDTLQIVAVLLVTVSYQGALTPPPAIWKDGMKIDSRCIFHPKSSLHSPPVGNCPTPSYLFFVLFNSIGFFCSVLLLLLHKRGIVAQTLLAWSLIALIVSYIILFVAASPDWILCLTIVGCLVILMISIYSLNSFMYRPVLRTTFFRGM